MFKPYKDGPLQFRFNVPEDGTVSIKIYDRNGKLVMSRQVDAAAGAHVEFWDGRTSAGDVAATGIYAVQFQGKGLRKTLKIAIVK
jgi:flagellar hook assembly protein FlgD